MSNLVTFYSVNTTTTEKKNIQKLKNVDCGPYLHYVTLNTSLGSYPRVIKLERCLGKNDRRLVCVENTTVPVEISVINSGTVKDVNHTSCKQVCRLKSKDCNEHEEFDSQSCKCKCKPKSQRQPCTSPSRWDNDRCQCLCPYPESTSCKIEKQIFNSSPSVCGCICKDKYFRRCSRMNKVLNTTTCLCIDTEPVSVTEKSSVDCQRKGLSGLTVIMVAIFEGIGILIIFFAAKSKKCCLKKYNSKLSSISSLERINKYSGEKHLSHLYKDENGSITMITQLNDELSYHYEIVPESKTLSRSSTNETFM